MTPMGLMTPGGMHTPMGLRTPMGGMNTPMGMRTPMGMNTPMGMRTPGIGTPMTRGGSSMNDLGEARGTVLAVKLDRIMDSVSGQTVMDPKGYLTDLNALSVQSDTDVSDIKKARTLLKSVTQSNPKHGPGWIAAARLEEVAGKTQDAHEVLNEARTHVPTASQIWVTAAQLEETQGNEKMVDLILSRALDSLSANGVTADRDAWIKHAEEAEKNGYIKTCNGIIKATVRVGLEDSDAKLFKQTIMSDAEASLARGAVETARAVYTHALGILKAKKGLWLRLAELEMKHGTPQSLDDVLSRAVSFCPNAEILWLMAAKQKWIHGDVSAARQILAEAFTHSKDSEAIHLAAIKLENENNEIQRARLLLMRSRMQCDTPKIWMQSVQLEREQGEYETAIKLCNEAILKHGGSHPKLWMILGQSYEEIQPPQLDDAAKAFDKGIQNNPRNVYLWLCASQCARKAGKLTKARAILEKARVQLPSNEFLWLGGVDVETAASNEKVATHLMSRALQECPNSGVLWSRAIELEPKASQNAKSVDALKKCENDTYVIVAVAKLFWKDMKTAKARKWFNRAVSLNHSLGDAWGAYLAFELACGSVHEQRDLIQRFAETQPNQGITWNPVAKQTKCWRMKWPQKMLTYLEIHYSSSLEKIDEGIIALLSGEEEKEEPE